MTYASNPTSHNDADNIILRSPKRRPSTSSKAAEAFPYYAGYSEAFAEDALRLFAPAGAIVLDPWNGAGTTSTVAATGGWDSISFDLNPVMIIVAKARLGSKIDVGFARRHLVRYLRDFKTLDIKPEVDPVMDWVGASAAPLIRYVVNRCLRIRGNSKKYDLKNISLKVSTAQIWQCVIILSVFRAVKRRGPSPVSSNPTWTKSPKFDCPDLTDSEWQKLLFSEIESLEKIASRRERVPSIIATTNILCGSSENLGLAPNSVDFILTSPPYCTRIDYAVSTLCELAILGLDKITVDVQLRRELLGSTANKGGISPQVEWGQTCLELLQKIKDHPSHGSRTYYYNNFVQYFNSLYRSICELVRVLKHNGIVCTVLQGSHYKEHAIDLPTIFSEMTDTKGLKLVSMHSFDASQFFVNINSSSLKYRGKKPMSEQVLVLRKC